MNIFITGGNGFIARNCYDYFSQNHTVYAPSHAELDVTNLKNLQLYINNRNIDCVLHTANIIGRTTINGFNFTLDDFYKSLLMFESVLHATKHCKYFFTFGSGAELGEYPNEDIINVSEDKLTHTIMSNYGGFVKSVMTKRLLDLDHEQHRYNLRIAGCFGKYEKSDRFITANLTRALRHESMLINQNRYMDFIYIQDLIKLIDFILHNSVPYRDINCTYIKKYSLLEIAEKIQEITQITVPIILYKNGLDKEYTLDGTKLASLNIPLLGLENGIRALI
jgi:GDP-L-fucose synthase